MTKPAVVGQQVADFLSPLFLAIDQYFQHALNFPTKTDGNISVFRISMHRFAINT